MPIITAYKGTKDGLPKETKIEKPDTLEGDHVLLEVTASGLCGTDLHYKTTDMVLGHEGVGKVLKTGPQVKHLKAGDRVGWGYATDSCEHCSQCLRGDDVYCPERAMYGYANLDQGSFASHAIWREAFLHVIPEQISDEQAAPLQCGGATVFSAIYGVQPNETVGVLGIGGLGHLALQFAAKMGCRVVALSGSSKKKDEALKLGAHQFVAMGEGEVKVSDLQAPIDRLLITTSAQPDWDALFPLMAPKSVVYPLTVSQGKLEIPYMPLLANGIAVQGSVVASRWMHRKMLEFAATHDVKAKIETFPMTEQGVRDAISKLESGDLHFRAVLKPVTKE